MIQLNRMIEVEKLKSEIESRLRNLNITYDNYESTTNADTKNKEETEEVNDFLILKTIICGAFYPNYFNGFKVDLENAQKMVAGRDPKNTVQLKNMPSGEGILYSQQLNDMFKPCANLVQVHFEETRAYVEFKSKCDSVPSNVNLGVYLAVQMRLLRIPIQLKRFNDKTTREKLNEYDRMRKMESSQQIRPIRGDLKGFSFFKMNNSSILPSDNENLATGKLKSANKFNILYLYFLI